MGFLTQVLTDTSPSLYGVGGMTFGRRTASGRRVNPQTALNYSACWAAKRLITETIATLPRVLYQQETTRKQPAIGHATYRMFRNQPNPRQGGVNHLSQQFGYLVDWGNCFAEKMFDSMGRITHLWPIHPSRVPRQNVRIGDDGLLVYRVINDRGPPTELHQSKMFHVPGVLCDDDYFGKGVIVHAAESIGMGLATETYGASHFEGGGSPPVLLSHPKTLSDTAQEHLRKSWAKRKDGMMAVEEGISATLLSYPPEANQFLETRQFNITEIARWYNLPPHLLREMSRSTNNNIESESMHFVMISIMPWLIRYEEECNRQLLIEEEQDTYFFKFILQGLLRGDMEARAKFYKEMFAMGVYSVNDILELEDRNPIGPMGDQRFVPMNMATLEYVYQHGHSSVKSDPVDTQVDDKEDEETDEDAKDMDDGKDDKSEAQLDELLSKLTALSLATTSTTVEPTVAATVTATASENELSATMTTLASASQAVLSATIGGLICHERRKAMEKSRDPRTFEAWCNEFYDDKFSQQFASQVQPLIAASKLFGTTVTAERLTQLHCDQSRKELLGLLATPLSEFATTVQSTVNNWDERAFTDSAMVFDVNGGQHV